jgi:acetyl esterase/lipase
MTQMDLVDPEMREAIAAMPPFVVTPDTIPLIRQGGIAALTPEAQEAIATAETVQIPHKGAPDVRALLYRPKAGGTNLPAVLHIHGGGYLFGAPEMGAINHRRWADTIGCVVLSVDYRLAPETPHPGPVEDCYAGLNWLHDNAEKLGVDRTRIGVSGESAGGGLAAALALLARDRKVVPLAYQHLIYPMIDDRTCVHPDPHKYVGELLWNRDANYQGWKALLGKEPGSPDVSAYAAAARAKDLSGLPPTYLSVGALDLFLEENLDYARRLTRVGVPVELHVYPGAFHGFQIAQKARTTLQAGRDSDAALARFLKG